jgi:hypothetical protein
MDKVTTERIKARAIELLRPLEAEFGVNVAPRRGNYGQGHCMLQFEFAETGEDGVAQTRDVEAFKTLCLVYGLQPEDLGRKFVSNGEVFTVTGLNPKSRKYPVCAMRARDGKRFKFSERIANVLIQR